MCTGTASPAALALPVYEGEISGSCLGVDARAFDADGNEVIGERGEMVITQPMPSMPVALWGDADGERYRDVVLRPLSRGLAPGRLDPVHRARQLRAHRALGRDAQPRRRAARDRRVLRGRRGAARDRRLRSSSTSRTTAAALGELLLFVVPAAGVEVDDELRARIAGAAQPAVAAPRARRDRRRARDPAHADRQEARGAGQADPARRGRPRRSPAATRSPTRRRWTRSSRWPPDVRTELQ